MLTLSGWSVVNIGTGLALAGNSKGETRYFHQMNVYFNSVNLAIAQLGYWGARKREGQRISLANSYRQQQLTEKTFLFNAALDGSYILGGLYLYERGNRQTGERKDRSRGFGKSLMVQGGFLLLFDGVMYHIQRRHGKWLDKRLEKIEMAAGPGSASLSWRL